MEVVQSVQKGYQMLQLLISVMPLPIQAFLQLVMAVLGVSFIVGVIAHLFE